MTGVCFYRRLPGDIFACMRPGGACVQPWLCLGPGPGLGHESMHELQRYIASVGEEGLLVDYPGVGGTPGGLEESWDGLRRLKLATRLGRVVVGVSWGCLLVPALVSPRTRAVILISPPIGLIGDTIGWPESGSMTFPRISRECWFRRVLLRHAIRHAFVDDDGAADSFLSSTTTSFHGWLLGRRMSRLLLPLEDWLRQTHLVRTWVVRGATDRLIGEEVVSRLHGLAECVVTVDGGHFPYLTSSGKLRAVFSDVSEVIHDHT